MATAFGVRLATVLFVASVLRDAARGTDANAALASALLAAAFGFLPGLVAGGACGRLATEQARRELNAELAATSDSDHAATRHETT
ncbi:hypothetical protein [Alienimonas chondri]|uniref:MFS transporter n=1 Tax=Alienimonas chondri TaxID=2681879 RepID=A0ABX1V922_9PLAN|nr:hypothetical protein [Alienimonas chondri]NNJ24397.1 hypothetical protein [Alienimonas chondri]